MTIFHIITLAGLGGAQSVVINLANKSVKDGHQVYVISSENGDMWKALDEKIVQIKLKDLQRSISPSKEVSVVRKLRMYYNQYKPDVVHLHSSKIGILGRLAFPKNKIIYTIHGFDSIRVAYRKFLPIEKGLKKRNAYIVSVSKYDTQNLASENIVTNVATIYNGVEDWSHFQGVIKGSGEVVRFMDELRVNKSFVVLGIARISSQKRFDLFCDVATRFKANNKVKFIWIGNKEHPKNVPDNVKCLGELVDAHQYLQYADLFILPSNYEGLPMAIIEALSYAKPVIASNVGGIPEVLNGDNGFAVKNTVEDFYDKINGFVSGEFDYASFSLNARKTYEDGFTINRMYQGYLDLYIKVYNLNRK